MSAIEKELHHRRRSLAHLKIRARVFLRTNIRYDDLGLTVVAMAIGAGIAIGVAAVRQMVMAMHYLLFGVPFEMHLSSTIQIERWRLVAIPCLGGLVYGMVAYLIWRWRPRDIVDAIEANALHGGRMSLSDSMRLTALTILSGGVGASVGLEAAFTQLGAGTASRVGSMLRLRRSDLRIFVGCGAAAAIAAAFNAPLAGAFYAFELIIGGYTLATLAPVGAAAVSAVVVTRAMFGAEPIFVLFDHVELNPEHYLVLAAIGVAGGALAIAAMVGVTFVEQFSRQLKMPVWARPAVGGLVLGAIALAFRRSWAAGMAASRTRSLQARGVSSCRCCAA